MGFKDAASYSGSFRIIIFNMLSASHKSVNLYLISLHMTIFRKISLLRSINITTEITLLDKEFISPP